MEAVYRGLENNSFGFVVEFGHKITTPPKETVNTSEQACAQVASAFQHLHYVKPLTQPDAHGLKHAGFKVPSNPSRQQSNYEYRTGRTFMSMQDKAQSNAVGQCAECRSMCHFRCARCHIFYCNIDCQRKDWPKHRYICAKIIPKTFSFSDESSKRLATISKPDTLIPTNKEKSADLKMPLSGNEVIMTAFSKTNVVFIRSKAYEDYILFFRVISEIHAVAKELNYTKTSVQCGQIVAAEFQHRFNRAMVLKADDWKRIKIIFIDYGYVDVKAIEELYELPDFFIRLPRMARPVVLKGVPDQLITPEVRKFMNSYVGTASLRLKYKEEEDFLSEKGIYRVELIDICSKKNLNDAIVTMCTPAESSVSKQYYRDYLRQYALPPGEKINLVVMDNSMLNIGWLSCTTKEFCIEIQGMQKRIENYTQSLKPQNYAPRVDELCLAKNSGDNKWYRGRCLNLGDNACHKIVFFDYGYIAEVPMEDIRRYPPTFTYPSYTWHCEIEGLPPHCDNSLVEKMMELIPKGSTIVCDTIKELEQEGNYSIGLGSVIEELKKAKLLTMSD